MTPASLRAGALDTTTQTMVQCLMALCFAAFTLGMLFSCGLMVRHDECRHDESACSTGYSWCDIWQDIRSIMSFVLGALVCHLGQRSVEERRLSEHGGEADASCASYCCLLW
mmetsp:Transcript_58738/g.132406  ORF Transcript_58738/g.132406 Transcript_58738/m.132406 type:complete len:112 (+) Transcript_58738:98-433(+)